MYIYIYILYYMSFVCPRKSPGVFGEFTISRTNIPNIIVQRKCSSDCSRRLPWTIRSLHSVPKYFLTFIFGACTPYIPSKTLPQFASQDVCPSGPNPWEVLQLLNMCRPMTARPISRSPVSPITPTYTSLSIYIYIYM